jgi:hypothetical protein
LDNR